MEQLDRLDKRVLHELDQNARQSLSKIAKRLRLGSDLVEYRLQKLQSSGMVNRFSPLIDPRALGLTIFKTYISHRMKRKTLCRFLEVIRKHPNTYWLAEGYGAWDILFSFGASNVDEFQEAQDKVLAEFGSHIIDMEVFTLVKVIRFPKHYLLGKGRSQIAWSSAPHKRVLDETERLILQALSEDCRMPAAEIARQIGSTQAVVSYRIEKLENEGTILGYRTQIDYAVFGMMVFKVFLELRIYGPKIREEIAGYCRNEPHITCFIQQIGRSQLEFEVEVSDYYHFREIIEKFRDKFGQNLGRVEHMLIKADHYHRVPDTKAGLQR